MENDKLIKLDRKAKRIKVDCFCLTSTPPKKKKVNNKPGNNWEGVRAVWVSG